MMSVTVSTHYADGQQIGRTSDFGDESTAAGYIRKMRKHSFADHFFVTTPTYKTKVRNKPLPVLAHVQWVEALTSQELQDRMPF